MLEINIFLVGNLNFTTILSGADINAWFTLVGGVLSGFIAGALTFFGVKLTLKHNENNENAKKKPRLEVLDHRLALGSGHLIDEQEDIVITVQNFGGTIAKNIEATITVDEFDLLTEEVHEVLKDKIKPPQRISSSVYKPNNSDAKAAYLVFENQLVNDVAMNLHYGTLNQKYFRMIGNCVPITINDSAKSEIVIPRALHGWITFFTSYNHNEYISQGYFNLTLNLKYSSIDNEDYIKKFSLKFIDPQQYEVVDGSAKKLLILRAKESK